MTAAFICGLTVELDECISSISHLAEFLSLTELVDARLALVGQKISKSELEAINNGVFGPSSFVGGLKTSKLIETLEAIRTVLKIK